MSAGALRPFEHLTPQGRLLRLRALAIDALRDYDLEVAAVSFVSTGFNTVFRVDVADGSTYALRVSPALRIHADGCEALEAAWMAALRRATDLAIPRVIESRGGSVVDWVVGRGVPEARSCVLFDWVGGRPLRERMRPDVVRKLGAATAQLHVHPSADASAQQVHASADASVPPAGALVADRVLYYLVEERLDELRPTYGLLLTDAVDRAQVELDALWRDPPHRPHLLHGDLQPGNVMVARNRIALIDFQDLIWGFDIQDVLIALRSFEHFEHAAALVEAFYSGYETVRPRPEVGPEMEAALRAGRHLNVLNFGLNLRGPGLDEFIVRHAGPVVDWMRSASEL